MSDTPNELRYAATHEWARWENGVVTVGITDYAQDALGDVVFVELPALNQSVQAGEEAGVVESVKAASDIYSPVSGTVVEVNDALEDSPELVNREPYGDGWFFRVQVDGESELGDLLDAETYRERNETDASPDAESSDPDSGG